MKVKKKKNGPFDYFLKFKTKMRKGRTYICYVIYNHIELQIQR